MKKVLILIFLITASCTIKNKEIDNNFVNFDNELNIDKFISELKIYSNKNPYPDIRTKMKKINIAIGLGQIGNYLYNELNLKKKKLTKNRKTN